MTTAWLPLVYCRRLPTAPQKAETVLATQQWHGEVARQLNAKCFYLAAPIYAGSLESRAAIVTQDVF